MVTVPELLPNVLDRDTRIQDGPIKSRHRPAHRRPDNAAIARAAEILNHGERVALLVRNGARGTHREIEQVADPLGAGAAEALLGKDVLSDEMPWFTGLSAS